MVPDRAPETANPSTADQRQFGSLDGCGWLGMVEGKVGNKGQPVAWSELGKLVDQRWPKIQPTGTEKLRLDTSDLAESNGGGSELRRTAMAPDRAPEATNLSTADQRQFDSLDGCGWSEMAKGKVGNKGQPMAWPEPGKIGPKWGGDSTVFHGFNRRSSSYVPAARMAWGWPVAQDLLICISFGQQGGWICPGSGSRVRFGFGSTWFSLSLFFFPCLSLSLFLSSYKGLVKSKKNWGVGVGVLHAVCPLTLKFF